MTLFGVAKELSDRLIATFVPGTDGVRPVYGNTEPFTSDPNWNDLVLFYEYFHGDTGAGLGASHQTGWTGVVARLIQMFGDLDAETLLRDGGSVLARPYRRLADEPIGDAATARRARGVDTMNRRSCIGARHRCTTSLQELRE